MRTPTRTCFMSIAVCLKRWRPPLFRVSLLGLRSLRKLKSCRVGWLRLKADSHARFLNAQQRLATAELQLQTALIVPLDESALIEFDRLHGMRGLKKIGRADLLIASISVARTARLVT